MEKMEAVCLPATGAPTQWTGTGHNQENYRKKLQALENLTPHSLILHFRKGNLE